MSPGSRDNPRAGEQVRLAGKKADLRLRARMVQAIRHFFSERHFLEVETPILLPAPAPESHIYPLRTKHQYLHTSPELCMKRLLAAGYPKIFQVAKCFRAGERGNLHLPEFTMLEWYRRDADYKALMEDCEALLLWVSKALKMGKTLRYGGMVIGLQGPWQRISLEEAFDKHASLTLKTAIERGSFEDAMVKEVEPKLGITRPAILYDYPASMAAMARLKPEDKSLAERFEVYIGGIELANGFSELTDPKEQKTRFEKELLLGNEEGRPIHPLPDKFLESLNYLPEASGIALGIDRLAMMLCDRPKIDHVVTFTPEEI